MSEVETERREAVLVNPRPVVMLKITLPTKEDVIRALQDKYPGIKVEEQPVEESTTPATS